MRVRFNADRTDEDFKVALPQDRRSNRDGGEEVIGDRFGDFAISVQRQNCQQLNCPGSQLDVLSYLISNPCERSEPEPSRVSSQLSRGLSGSARSKRTSLRAASPLSSPRTMLCEKESVSVAQVKTPPRKVLQQDRLTSNPNQRRIRLKTSQSKLQSTDTDLLDRRTLDTTQGIVQLLETRRDGLSSSDSRRGRKRAKCA